MYVINRNSWWFKNEFPILEDKIIGQYASVIPVELSKIYKTQTYPSIDGIQWFAYILVCRLI